MDNSTTFRNGSTRANSMEVGDFRLIDATFPPHTKLNTHYHDRAGCSVVLEGVIEKVFSGKSYTSPTSSIVVMPPQEQHEARFAYNGARILIIEPSLASDETLGPFTNMFNRIHNFQDVYCTRIAWQICGELAAPDAISPLAVEGLVLALLAQAARRHKSLHGKPSPPAWLGYAREYLHDSFSANIRVSEVAENVGVHPVHLARVFRLHVGISPGEYLRQVRLEWAMTQLITTGHSIGDIAFRAGFADQSHFTRAFKRQVGLTPGQYRRQVCREVH